MIRLKLNEPDFEYDIRGLLTSFFPGEPVETGDGEDTKRQLSVFYGPESFRLSFVNEGKIWEREGKNGAERKETKNRLKRLLYGLLSEQTGKQLPWGTLTGIRPTKLSMTMLEQGEKPENILTYMKEEYLVGEKKARLGLAIALREQEILKKIDYETGYSLYIGIPFCPTTCLYCSFTSYPMTKWAPRMEEYLDALFEEIDYGKEAFRGKKLNTIYIGGGTPTSLSPRLLCRLLDKLENSFDFSHLQEFTVEAGRPDSVDEEKLRALRSYPVTRISINPQTMKEETLKLIGRRHTVQDVRNAYELARKLGFDNINMDLILGLPGETGEDVRRTMEEIQKLGPDNLTVHSLAVKRAARLKLEMEQYKALPMENSEAQMEMVEAMAADMGLYPYYLYRQKNMAGNLENVGYGALGKEGIYNILIMEEKQSILALGAGATTKAVFPDGRIARAENVKDIEQYLSRTGEMIQRKRDLFEKGIGR